MIECTGHTKKPLDITEYIEIFYNRQRRQAALGYLAPAVFVKRRQREIPLNAA